MNRNQLLALVMIGGILLATPWYMKNVAGVKPAPRKEVTQPVAEAPAAQVQPDRTAPQAQTLAAQNTIPAAVTASVIPADTLWVETDLYRGAFSSLGGGTVIHWELKDYLKGDKEHGIPVNLIPEGASGNLAMVLDGGVDLSGVVFEKVSDIENRGQRKVAYRTALANGATVTRRFTFEESRYDFDLEIAMTGINTYDAGYTLNWQSGLNPTELTVKDDMPYLQSVAMQGDELLKTKEKPTGFSEGRTLWAAVRGKYFTSALIPRSEPGRGVRLQGEKTQIADQDKQVNWKRMQMGLVMAGAEVSDLDVFIGPLDLPTVKGLGVDMEKMMNFGWVLIKPFSVAFYYVLQAMFGVIGNWGWTIILFSIMIKVVLYPLTRKSFHSMKEMQKLQPQIKAIQEKHKSDPQRMNQEVQKVYKEHGVSPLGGCLPMLLQMPVLFALFNLFRTTIMLRQAEWLMISDLSAPDGILMGFHLLPILMGVTMIFQQKLTGGQNPQQKMMAYFMPIMMTFMFYRISAGLNLYYMMFNLLTIAQELLVKGNKKQE